MDPFERLKAINPERYAPLIEMLNSENEQTRSRALVMLLDDAEMMLSTEELNAVKASCKPLIIGDGHLTRPQREQQLREQAQATLDGRRQSIVDYSIVNGELIPARMIA